MSKTTIPTKKTKGLSNPAAVAAASSPEGQQAIGKALEVAKVNAETGQKLILFAFKLAVVIGGGYLIYRAITKRFIKLHEDSNLDPANISDGQASAKASALYEAMYGPGANFDQVRDAIAGLNHNGWIKVYNAFGHQKPALPFADPMTLDEWIVDQFDNDDLAKLRFVLPNEF